MCYLGWCVTTHVLVRSSCYHHIKTLRPRQDGCQFPDDIFKCIFINENIWILIEISLKFVPKGPINKIPAFVQIMAWRHSGDKPLSEPMMFSLQMHICVTRPQWVKAWTKLLTFCVDIFSRIFFIANVWIWNKTSLFYYVSLILSEHWFR